MDGGERGSVGREGGSRVVGLVDGCVELRV